MNMIDDQSLNLAVTKLPLDALLKALNKSINDIDKIYVGDTHGCRCGCRGKYHNINTRGAKLAYARLIRLMNEDKFIKWKDIDYSNPDSYIDFPYITQSGNERSICLCFK